MVNSIQRDQRRRLLFLRFEVKRVRLKSVSQDLTLLQDRGIYAERQGTTTPQRRGLQQAKRDAAVLKSEKLPRNSSKTRSRNRCVLTARARGVLRFCKLSRIRVRELASQGALSGVSKASW